MIGIFVNKVNYDIEDSELPVFKIRNNASEAVDIPFINKEEVVVQYKDLFKVGVYTRIECIDKSTHSQNFRDTAKIVYDEWRDRYYLVLDKTKFSYQLGINPSESRLALRLDTSDILQLSKIVTNIILSKEGLTMDDITYTSCAVEIYTVTTYSPNTLVAKLVMRTTHTLSLLTRFFNFFKGKK